MKPLYSPQPELFRQACKQLRVSQYQLAKMLGVNRSTICRLAQGDTTPSIAIIKKLTELTGMAPELLIQQELQCLKLVSRSPEVPETCNDLDREQLMGLVVSHQQAIATLKRTIATRERDLATRIEHQAIRDVVVKSLEHTIAARHRLLDHATRTGLESKHLAVHAEATAQAERKLEQKRSLVRNPHHYQLVVLRQEIDLLSAQLEMRQAMLTEAEQLYAAADSGAQVNTPNHVNVDQGQLAQAKAQPLLRHNAPHTRMKHTKLSGHLVRPANALSPVLPDNVAREKSGQRCTPIPLATPALVPAVATIHPSGTNESGWQQRISA